VAEAWDQGLVTDAMVASSEAQAEALWAIRDDVEAMMSAHKPLFLYDVSLRQSDMQAYVEKLEAEVARQWPASTTMVFGHIADGNLHLSISTGDASHHHAIDDLVYGMLRPLNGSVSAEHGIGLEKRAYLDLSRTEEEIAVMRQLKQMLDPKDTLNPGKVLGSL
jgi:FAD/FMN-containing dehydrogenase